MSPPFWERGSVIVGREAWRGRDSIRIPERVVEDDEEGLVFYLCEGTRYAFPPGGWPFGDARPWAENGGFRGEGVLVRQARATRTPSGTSGPATTAAFAGWYVNMQEPIRRDGWSFVTQDEKLDIWIELDGSWRWEDEKELEDWIPQGRFTRAAVRRIRAEGERVIAEWPSPPGWEEWCPDPAFAVPELPDERRL